ncbi:MAG: hypothetical protein IPP78_00205 [Holophagaceae bacterium]|nr:hypothetical protein [Holophagaceae bacterium]
MSGIFGIFRFDGAPVQHSDLNRMSEAMAFYGADGGDIWQGQKTALHVGIGSRLRHVTTEDAYESQPLVADGLALVAAARLDNREELIDALGVSGNEAFHMPDSTLLLGAYQRWGEACVDHLVGDWSFAIWDPSQQCMLVARDHHGNTGLYWHQDGHRLAFATSLKALLALSDTPKHPDLFKVAQILSAWPGDGIRTAYEGIQALPPAHILKVSRSGAETRRYWFPESLQPLKLRRDEDYLEQFLEIYTAAVKARLRTMKPVGATLSAGLDSGSIVALAGPLLAGTGTGLVAFTAIPRFSDQSALKPRQIGNEWDLAHATALMAGIGVHLPINAEAMGILESLQRQVDIHGGPGHSGANYHWILTILELARSRGLGVVLTGQQGNATVSATGEASWFWSSIFRGDIREAWRALESSEPDPWLAFRRQVLSPLLRPPLQAFRRHRALRQEIWLSGSALSPGLSRELQMASRMCESGHDPAFGGYPEPVNLALLGPGRNSIGAIWHELGASHGLEIRDPTADRRIIEFTLRLPASQFRNHGENRSLIRRAMTGRMPYEVLHSRFKGLQASDLGTRILAERPALAAAIDDLSNHSLASRCLALPKMSKILADLKAENAAAAYAECGTILVRGLNVGLFLQQF